jgi:hypothetical protein
MQPENTFISVVEAIYFFTMAQQPPLDQGVLIIEDHNHTQ